MRNYRLGGGEYDKILPQNLYNRNQFAEVAEALTSVALAEKALAAAQKANDRDIVDSLWDGE